MTIQNDNMPEASFEKFLLSAFSVVYHALRPGGSFYVFHSNSSSSSFVNSLTAAGLMMRQNLVWVKNHFVLGRQDYQWMHEPIIYGWKDGAPHRWFSDRRQSTLLDIERNPFVKRDDGQWQLKVGNRAYTVAADAVFEEVDASVVEARKPQASAEHPTMKPVDLLIRLIRHSSQRGEVVLDTFGGSGSTLIAAEQTGRTACLMELDEKFVDVIRKRYAEFAHGEGCDWARLTPRGG